MPLEKRFLTTREKATVDRLARKRQPQREHINLNQLTTQPDRHITEIDLGFLTRPMALTDKHLRRAPTGLYPDLWLAVGDIVRSV